MGSTRCALTDGKLLADSADDSAEKLPRTTMMATVNSSSCADGSTSPRRKKKETKSAATTMAEVQRFVNDGISAELRPIVERLREASREAMPDTHEIVYHDAIGYSPTGSPFDRIVYILPAKDHATLGFFFGTHLADPEHLLVGSGLRMRHVKVRTIEEAGDPKFQRLLRAAASDATSSLTAIHRRRKKSFSYGTPH
jgi:hypothetical protein